MNTNVTLRKRPVSNGKSALYLDYWPPVFNLHTKHTRRHEYLHTFIYENPKDEMQRSYNKEMLRIAEAIRCKRALDVARNTLELFDEKNLKGDFLKYFEDYATKRNYSRGPQKTFSEFVKGKCTFGNLSVRLMEQYRDYLLKDCRWLHSPTKLHLNTASNYFRLLKSCVWEAYRDHFLPFDLSADMEKIKTKPSKREYLTLDEVRRLRDTPCEHDVLKRASMFSILTGLRISDILSLRWEDLTVAPDGGPCIRKRMQKPNREETVFISEEALSFCGPRCQLGTVFYGLERSMTIVPLKKWVQAAGITKHISFHCFRHTFATLQIAGGTDIYTLQHQMTHRDIRTTEIYAALVDEKRRASAKAIKL